MTKKTYFLAGNYYFADLANLFAGLFTDGVLTGFNVAAHSPANLSVDVPLGKAVKSGLVMYSDATENVLIGTNTSGYPRIDVIACDMDNNSIIAVPGTPASSPTVPVLTGNKVALARVLVGNNVSVINTANITDMRVYSQSVNADKLEAWRSDLAFTNSWVSHAPDHIFSFRKNNPRELEFKGMLRGGTVGVAAGTLPPTYWPLQEAVIGVVSNGALSGIISVGTDGVIKVLAGNNTYVSFDGLRIPLD
jgi:hypothetical protein